MIQQSGLLDLLLNQFVESVEIERHAVLRVTLRLHWVALEGCDLGQELLVKQPQLHLPLKDILAIENHPFPFVV